MKTARLVWDYGDGDGFFGLWRLGDAKPSAGVHRLAADGERWLGLMLDDSKEGGAAAVRRSPDAACRWVEDEYIRRHPDERETVADACADRLGCRDWPTAEEVAVEPVTAKTPKK